MIHEASAIQQSLWICQITANEQGYEGGECTGCKFHQHITIQMKLMRISMARVASWSIDGFQNCGKRLRCVRTLFWSLLPLNNVFSKSHN